MGIEIAIGVVFGVVILLLVSRRLRRRTRYWRSDVGQGQPRWDAEFKSREDRVAWAKPDYTDPAEQLRIVSNTGFSAKRVMSLGEYGVFKIAEQEAAAVRAGFRVFAQTSLGEVLESTSAEGFKAINSKRVDVLVVGPTGLPVLAIEHQGEGHTRAPARCVTP